MKPRRVGQYELYEEIASGGMATVRFGRFVNELGLGRLVAVKCLHPGFATDEAFTSLLVDEAKLALRVKHPNVVPVLDVLARGDEAFLVMDYVHGVSLSELMKRLAEDGVGMPPRIASAIICDVLEGIHAAHEATSVEGTPLDIVHRDVSPQNVLVDADGVARVFDFGVARAVGRAQNTSDGVVKGKTSYMSPEQFMRDEVDRRTDVFAASVVFWEMLTGRRLFPELSVGAVYRRMLEPDIEVPSKLCEGVPETYDTVVLRGLSQTASERYATARDMAAEVERAGPVASQREVGAWVRSLAAETLQLRSDRIARIEASAPLPTNQRHLSNRPPAPPSDDKATWAPPSRTDADPELESTRDPVPASVGTVGGTTRESAAAAPSLAKTAAPTPASRVWIAAGALVLVVAAVWLLATWSAGPTRSTPAARPASAAPLDSGGDTLPVASSLASSSPRLPLSSAPASASSAPPPAASMDAPRPPRTVATVRPPPTQTEPPPRSVNCDPPYFLDERGVRVLKPECL